MERLTPLLRRVLCTLPAWREDEEWVIAHEIEEHGVSVRRHNLTELGADLKTNPHAQVPYSTEGETTRPMTDEEIVRCLDYLVARGWAAVEDGEYWRMTQAGFEEIHRPEAAPENVVPGSVNIELDPATAKPNTEMGVQ